MKEFLASTHDLQTLSAALDDIYSAAATVGVWPHALQSVAGCFAARGCVLIGQRGSSGLFSISSPALEAAGKEYDEGAWKLDFLAQRAVLHGIVDERPVFTERHLASSMEIDTHPFFTGFRKRHELGSFMATCLEPQPDIRVVLSMQGAIGRGAFNEAHCEIFDCLAKHVERALSLSSRILEAEAEAVALSQTLSRMNCGIFVLDGDSQVLFSNSVARDILGDEIRIAGGRLRVLGQILGRDDRRLKLPPSDNGGGLYAPRPPIPVRRNDQLFCVIYSVPLTIDAEHPVEQVLRGAQELIIVSKAEDEGHVNPALLRDLCGITLGEARLAALIASGRSLNVAAKELGITVESARTVLKRVFAKTGVSRQTDLALLVSRLAIQGNL